TLVEDEGFLPSEIMVLSPCSFERSCAHALPEDVRKILTPLDESAVHAPSRRAAGFAQVGHYKGLESEAVILVDLPSPGTDEELRPFHYVGMSRARALLSLICVAPGEVWKTPCK
ncbi:MAG: ATP-binding domain-containing protein, partial [Zoogloeaceae bacterium]|nr:ATP-binding domain-containing protein [Zoogloeaceae bacterium]